MKIEFNPANVANLLKAIVNRQCADGFFMVSECRRNANIV